MDTDDSLVTGYLLEHISPEPPELARLNRDTHLYHLRPRMCSGHLQGRLLKMLVRMARPELVLEIGTFTGYSALCLAEGLLSDTARVHTFEIDDELEDFIRAHLDPLPLARRIHLHIGDALELLDTVEGTFDMAFIDADKRDYIAYYEKVLPRLRPGGIILADNTLWDGKVAHTQARPDAQTRGILQFNDHVANDARVETVILPLRDGLTIIYKK